MKKTDADSLHNEPEQTPSLSTGSLFDTPTPELPKPIPQEPLPEKIGHYRIEGLYDKGGMSLLYMGVHPKTKESAIVKVLSPKYLSNPEVVQRFLNEAKIISLTDHPNIVKLFDYGQWENGLYIAMEFVRGTSLRKILSQQPFSLKRALEIILETSYALCHLHTHGVIHGDLKPENILITEAGNAKIIDFGIARLLSEQNSEFDTAGKLVGTPIYMSPEQRANPQLISFQSDIYSLGILVYELVLGKITHGRIILSLAPKGMQKILTKALQPKPEERYLDIVDFITDVSNYINSGDVLGDRPGSDYFFELFESMENIQSELLPAETPKWNTVDIGFCRTIGMGLYGLYYDYLPLQQGKYLFFAAKCPAKGGEGVLQSAMIRAQVRILYKQLSEHTVEHFIQSLDQHIQQDLFNTKYQIACMLYDTKTSTCTCLHNTVGLFFHFQKQSGKINALSCPLDASIHIKLQPLDRLFFIGIEKNIIDSQEASHQISYEKCIADTLDLTPQKQVDFILRKLRLKAPVTLDNQPILLSAWMRH